MKKIVYIGNNLQRHSKYKISYQILSELFMREGWTVYQASDKKNIVLRMLDMIWKVISHPEADYILIDTFSTKNFYYAYIISFVARLMKKKIYPYFAWRESSRKVG